MTIQYFAANQNLVFVPALFALLAATVVVCLPIAFAPGLRRSSRRTPLIALVVVVAVAGLIATVLLAIPGFRTLGDERAAVRTWVQSAYRIPIDSGQAGELVDGGSPAKTLPTQAAALGLTNPGKQHALKLVPTTTDGDSYALTFGGKPLPKTP